MLDALAGSVAVAIGCTGVSMLPETRGHSSTSSADSDGASSSNSDSATGVTPIGGELRDEVDGSTDFATIKDLIHRHYEYTGSTVAWRILSGWKDAARHFVKVMPVDYRRALEQMQARWRPTDVRRASIPCPADPTASSAPPRTVGPRPPTT